MASATADKNNEPEKIVKAMFTNDREVSRPIARRVPEGGTKTTGRTLDVELVVGEGDALRLSWGKGWKSWRLRDTLLFHRLL